jgi:predicted amidohydrolase YtcJ
MDLINAIRPPWTDTQRRAFINRMATDGLAKGLTGVHNARTPKADADLYVKMAQEGTLPMRVNLMVSCGNNIDYCGDQFERVTDAADGRLTMQSVKLVADGALGSRGAALLEDYSDQEGWKGLMLMEEGKWDGAVRKWYNEVSIRITGCGGLRVRLKLHTCA